jgi:anti-anti-sigma regulatory factor
VAANIYTSTRGNTLTVRVSGPLDRRIASSLFSRFLMAKSRYDELVIDLTGVDEVYDAGLAALRLLRTRARQAGKRLAVVGCYKEGCIGHSPALNDEEQTPVPAAAGYTLRELSPFLGAPGLHRAHAPAALSDAA